MNLNDDEIKAFMDVLLPIQARLKDKYGHSRFDKWRNKRINRPKEFYYL